MVIKKIKINHIETKSLWIKIIGIRIINLIKTIILVRVILIININILRNKKIQ